MTARFVLDTSVLSEEQRARPDRRVLDRIRRHRSTIATGAPVLHELRYGALRLGEGARRTGLLDWLERVEQTVAVLPYDAEAATWHADERARLGETGRTVPFVDGQIAAIAATNNLTLVTHNVKDFRRFRALRVESWWR